MSHLHRTQRSSVVDDFWKGVGLTSAEKREFGTLPPPWRRYFVGVDGAPAAGNVTRRFAMRYAEGQASFGRTAVVSRMKRDGTLHIVRTIGA